MLLRPALHPVVDLGRRVIVLEVHHAPLLGLHLLVAGEREHARAVPEAGHDVHVPHRVPRLILPEAAELRGGGAGGEADRERGDGE